MAAPRTSAIQFRQLDAVHALIAKEGHDNPQELGYEWYCPACRSLVVAESVTYKELHTCGAHVKLLSPDEIVALEDEGEL